MKIVKGKKNLWKDWLWIILLSLGMINCIYFGFSYYSNDWYIEYTQNDSLLVNFDIFNQVIAYVVIGVFACKLNRVEKKINTVGEKLSDVLLDVGKLNEDLSDVEDNIIWNNRVIEEQICKIIRILEGEVEDEKECIIESEQEIYREKFSK